MTVLDVDKDLTHQRMTLTCDFDAPVERVWQIWSDPRLLERWWGPPTYPATVTSYDLRPGGRVRYLMTGPEGDQHHGWWEFRSVQAPHSLEFEDGFAHADGTPNSDLPTTVARVTLTERPGGGTTMQIVTSFASTQALEQMLAMGMDEGMREALGQIDALLEPATAG